MVNELRETSEENCKNCLRYLPSSKEDDVCSFFPKDICAYGTDAVGCSGYVNRNVYLEGENE